MSHTRSNAHEMKRFVQTQTPLIVGSIVAATAAAITVLVLTH
ncbi:hypothetical protein [Methylorubrum thiocyanatum]